MPPIYRDASKLTTFLDHELSDRLLRVEEYSGTGRDEHGRFVSSTSKYSNRYEPEVSISLKKTIGDFNYPNNNNFVIVLTHDIDLIQPSLPRSLISASRHAIRGEMGEMVNNLLWRTKGIEASPYLCSKEIITLERKYGANSTFFFMTQGPDRTGAGYDPESIRNEIHQVKDGGCEVGLHGSYGAAESVEQLQIEKNKLQSVTGKNIRGYRNHYLRFNVPYTWSMLESAGFDYDSTLGFHDDVGFRDGMCHPYRPFDVRSNRTFQLWEIPLHVMDCALYAYQNATPQQGWQLIQEMMNQVQSCKGILCLLWHNEVFSNPRLREWKRIYEKVLVEGEKKGAWMCGCSELVDWWKDHAI